MTNDEVKALIEAGIENAEVTVNGDGSHFEAIVVAEVFADMRPVKRQQTVYSTVNEQIGSGAIHALTIKAFTASEWESAQKFQIARPS